MRRRVLHQAHPSSPWCSRALKPHRGAAGRINAALSELIYANRQMESSRWPASALVPPRVCPVALPHTSPPIAPAPHVVGGIDIPPPLTPPPPTTCCGSAPYSLHGAGGLTAWHQAFASIDRPVAMGRGDLTAGSAGVAVCTTSWPPGDIGKRRAQSAVELVLTRCSLHQEPPGE